MIQQNASASEEVSSTAEELSSQAEQLQSSIDFFKINGHATIREQAVERKSPAKLGAKELKLTKSHGYAKKAVGHDLEMHEASGFSDSGFEKF